MCNIMMQTEISALTIDYCGYCGSIDSSKKSNIFKSIIFPSIISHHKKKQIY